MSKTTLIGITQVEGKPTVVQVDVLEDGVLNPRLGYEKPMTAAQVITLVCKVYDIAPSYQLDAPKQVFKCVWCHKHFSQAIKSCDRCGSDVQ